MPPTSGNSGLAPEAGARFLLELDSAGDAASAAYRVAIYTPGEVYEGTATLDDEGGVTLAIDAPAPLVERLEMFAKLTARAAGKRREDGLPAWPARVLRWRPD
ncbi:MAG: hypothetical protein ACM31C_18410 [Acidobacteriota bacterium]